MKFNIHIFGTQVHISDLNTDCKGEIKNVKQNATQFHLKDCDITMKADIQDWDNILLFKNETQDYFCVHFQRAWKDVKHNATGYCP